MKVQRIWIDENQHLAAEYKAAVLTLPDRFALAGSQTDADLDSGDLWPNHQLPAIVAKFLLAEAGEVGLQKTGLTVEFAIGCSVALSQLERIQAISALLEVLGVPRNHSIEVTVLHDSLLVATEFGGSQISGAHRLTRLESLQLRISGAERRITIEAPLSGGALPATVKIEDRNGTSSIRPTFRSLIGRLLMEH